MEEINITKESLAILLLIKHYEKFETIDEAILFLLEKYNQSKGSIREDKQ